MQARPGGGKEKHPEDYRNNRGIIEEESRNNKGCVLPSWLALGLLRSNLSVVVPDILFDRLRRAPVGLARWDTN